VFRYLVRRLLWAFVLLIAVTMVTYLIFFMIPQDPARLACGQRATPDCINSVRKLYHLNEPVPVQYWYFLSQLSPVTFTQGIHIFKTPSLGISFANRRNVNDVIKAAAPVTASLVFGGAVLWMMISLPLGILSALRPRSLLDRSAMVFVLIGISLPPFFIGLIFQYGAFKLNWSWLPFAGYANLFNMFGTVVGEPSGPVPWFEHLILPWITFAILFAAQYVRMTRASVMETMNEDYVRTARAKGAAEASVIRVHVLRNALLPIVTMLGMDIGLALGGAVFTETVFGLPGLGRTAVQSLTTADLPTTQGIIVFSTLCIVTFNLLVDLIYAWVDPRIRLA
jgi:peptide/nickel transport system permease protein